MTRPHPHRVTVVMNAVIGYSFIAADWCRAAQEHPNPGFHQLCLILPSSLIPYLHDGQSILSAFPTGSTILMLIVIRIMDCASLIQRWNSGDIALTELQLWHLCSMMKAKPVSHAVSTPFPQGFSRQRPPGAFGFLAKSVTEDVWHDALSSPSGWQTYNVLPGLSNSNVGRRGTHQSQNLCVWYVLSLFSACGWAVDGGDGAEKLLWSSVYRQGSIAPPSVWFPPLQLTPW